MAWVIDTCVLIDVRLNDPIWALRSAECLNAYTPDGLIVSPITFVELAPAFGGDLVRQKAFLTRFGIRFDDAWLMADTEQCFRPWNDWIQRKRSGQAADVQLQTFSSLRSLPVTKV